MTTFTDRRAYLQNPKTRSSGWAKHGRVIDCDPADAAANQAAHTEHEARVAEMARRWVEGRCLWTGVKLDSAIVVGCE